MKRSPLSDTELSFPLVWKKTKYTVNAQLTHDGDGIEKWAVEMAGRKFTFHNNRPHLATRGGNKPVEWHMMTGFEYIRNKPDQSDDAIQLLDEIQQQIEKRSMGQPVYQTFKAVRNK